MPLRHFLFSAQLSMTALRYFFLATVLCTVTLGVSPAFSQPADEAVAENQDAGEGAAGTDEPEAAEHEPALDISDALPVGEVVESWQTRYLDFMEEKGFGDSFSARMIATGVIGLLFLIGLVVSRFVARVIHRRFFQVARRLRITQKKFNFYYKFLYWLFIAVLALATLVVLAATWDWAVLGFMSDDTAISLLATALTIYLLILGASIAIDVINGLLESSFRHWSKASSSRINTLLPIAKNTVFVVVFVMFLLTLLAEIGINVMPLLAGAGVLGIAIGFGAQTLVKDLLTGFIIILEDLIQVGDVASLGGKSGVIERITIRKVQLRDMAGTVYTVPFGEISIVENLTKDFSYALFDIRISYREDVDQVSLLLKQLADELRADPEFTDDILEPLELIGVDKFEPSAVIIKARIKTRPIKQWRIAREFNRRMKKRFDAQHVEMPFPHQTIYFGEDKSGRAPLLQARIIDADNAQRPLAQPSPQSGDDCDAAKPGRGVEKDAQDAKIKDAADQTGSAKPALLLGGEEEPKVGDEEPPERG